MIQIPPPVIKIKVLLRLLATLNGRQRFNGFHRSMSAFKFFLSIPRFVKRSRVYENMRNTGRKDQDMSTLYFPLAIESTHFPAKREVNVVGRVSLALLVQVVSAAFGEVRPSGIISA